MIHAMRKALIRGVLCLGLLDTWAFGACGLPQPRLVCQEYFAESAVVVAKLVRVRKVEPLRPGRNDGTYYYMEAVERVKGKILNRFQVYEENVSGRATFDWKRGENYLLFISYSKEDRGWELDGCGNSSPMAKAQKVLKEIGAIKAGKGHETILGFIASEETLPEEMVVKIAGGKSRTILVENREFKVRVEPGTYVVTPVHPGWQFEKDAFSYDDPQKITIEPGKCAQIQFQGKKSPVSSSPTAE
jgi:hypothetical protein